MTISAPTTIGQAAPNVASATTIVLTSTAAVAAGAKIVEQAAWTHATIATVAITGGGLTHTVDSVVSNGSLRLALAWADAPSGVATSTAFTATWSAGVTSRYLQSYQFTGAATGAAISRISGTTGTTTWSSGTQSVTAGNIACGGAYCDANGGTLTEVAAGGNTEIHDQNIAGDSAKTSQYQIPVSTGSIASTGTWSGAPLANAAISVVFAAAGAAPAARQQTLTTLGVGV